MDLLGGLHVIYLQPEYITLFFRDNSHYLRKNKGLEVWAGCKIAEFYSSSNNKKYMIGFPLKDKIEIQIHILHLTQFPQILINIIKILVKISKNTFKGPNVEIKVKHCK